MGNTVSIHGTSESPEPLEVQRIHFLNENAINKVHSALSVGCEPTLTDTTDENMKICLISWPA